MIRPLFLSLALFGVFGTVAIPHASAATASVPPSIVAQALTLFESESAAQAHCPHDVVVWLNTRSGIYVKVNLLAQLLFDTYGLTLQQSKTMILTSEAFLDRLDREVNTEVTRLTEQFDELLDDLGIDEGPYLNFDGST